MRICLLTKADSLCWTQHYVDAFRERAEVITVGPGVDAQQIKDWNLGALADSLIPNDIEADLHQGQSLRDLLPGGWEPDLIVAIGCGGTPIQPSLDGLHCPTAYVTIDTWQSISDYAECQLYDFVFVAQRSYVDRIRAVGGSNVHWLPLGFNPGAHYPVDIERSVDVSFVGTVAVPVHNERYDLLVRLASEFSTVTRDRLFRDGLCRTIAQGKLVFNHSAVEDVNMRVFEVLGMGRPLITNRNAAENGLLDLFVEGEHLIVYDDEVDLVDKVRYYLAHDAEREAIAQAGHRFAMERHRYVDRVDALLATMSDRIPGFGESSAGNGRAADDRMASLVPYGTRRILDIGLRLRPLLSTMRLRGAESIVGVTEPHTGLDGDGYDSIILADDLATCPSEVDAMLIDSTALLGGGIETALDMAYGRLSEGGTVVVRLTARDFSRAGGVASAGDLNNAVLAAGFHPIVCEASEATSEGAGVIVYARKRTRRLVDTVRESLERYPQINPEDLLDWARLYGPDY